MGERVGTTRVGRPAVLVGIGGLVAAGVAARAPRAGAWHIETPPTVVQSEARVLQGHTDWVYGVAFSPDGQTLLTAWAHPPRRSFRHNVARTTTVSVTPL